MSWLTGKKLRSDMRHIKNELYSMMSLRLDCSPPEIMTIDDPGVPPQYLVISNPGMGRRLMNVMPQGIPKGLL